MIPVRGARLFAVALSAALLAAVAVAAGPQNHAADAFAYQQDGPPVYDESADAAADIAAALEAAGKENRRVLIQWGGNWCGWCKKLHELFASDRDIGRKLQYEYDVVYVDIGQWDKNLEVAEKYGADFKSNGVPYLTVLSPSGDVVTHQETGALEEGDHHDPAKVMAFLEANQPEPWDAGHVLQAAASYATRTNRNLFLHIGAPWCGWCKRLERWLDRKAVKEIWARDFVDLKIDQDRMAGAREILDSEFGAYTGQGIPWFAVINPGNGEVLHDSMIMPDGSNVGCPWNDEEIALFEEWLKDACTKITQEEQKILIAELRAQKAEEEAGAR